MCTKITEQSCIVRSGERAREYISVARLTCKRGAVGQPTVRILGEERRMNCVESLGYDPKPGDLSVGRLKFSERGMEGRTGDDLQISRMTYV